MGENKGLNEIFTHPYSHLISQ